MKITAIFQIIGLLACLGSPAMGSFEVSASTARVVDFYWFVKTPMDLQHGSKYGPMCKCHFNRPQENGVQANSEECRAMCPDGGEVICCTFSGVGLDQPFVYSVRIRNDGEVKIDSIVWDYVFSDRATGKELARHSFSSEIKLAGGKSKLLTSTSSSPPTSVVRVEKLSEDVKDEFKESIELKTEAFRSSDRIKTFFHGHSYTANPLACAVGSASLTLFETENCLKQVELINAMLRKYLPGLRKLEWVRDVRIIGVVGRSNLPQTIMGILPASVRNLLRSF